jgi:hypothetical protein
MVSVVCGRCNCIEVWLYCMLVGIVPDASGQAVIFSNKYESSLDLKPAPPLCGVAHCDCSSINYLPLTLDGLQVITPFPATLVHSSRFSSILSEKARLLLTLSGPTSLQSSYSRFHFMRRLVASRCWRYTSRRRTNHCHDAETMTLDLHKR